MCLAPFGRTLVGMGRELRWGARATADRRSLARYALDVVLYRALRLGELPGAGCERCIRLRGGLTLAYRLNRGDIQSIREVWVDESYRLAFPAHPGVVVDVGANIGLTSMFLTARYGCGCVVAVEPVPANAELARRNLAANEVPARVVEAAVGPCEGTTGFEMHRDSNRGRAGGTDHPVPMVSMPTILAMTPSGRADLVKLDIEGGEEALLLGDVAWLDDVGALVVEFHPPLVDQARLVSVLRHAGFRYLPAGSAWPGSMDSFVRDDWRPTNDGSPDRPSAHGATPGPAEDGRASSR